MNITHTPIVLPDGRSLCVFDVCDTLIDPAAATFLITVGGWESDLLKAISKPVQCFDIKVQYDDWNPDYFHVADQIVMAHPDWSEVGPSRLSPEHIWRPNEQIWQEPPAIPIGVLKAAKWKEIKQSRATAEYGGFTWDGSTFDSDQISQGRITGAVTLAQMNSAFTIGWTLADNSVRTLTATDMIAVGVALGQHVNACHERARVLRGEIEGALTAEELGVIAF